MIEITVVLSRVVIIPVKLAFSDISAINAIVDMCKRRRKRIEKAHHKKQVNSALLRRTGHDHLFMRTNFNFIGEIAPIASIVDSPLVIEVNPSFPARTVPEFVAYASCTDRAPCESPQPG